MRGYPERTLATRAKWLLDTRADPEVTVTEWGVEMDMLLVDLINAPEPEPFVWWSDADDVVFESLRNGKHLPFDQRDAYLSAVEISSALPLYTAAPAPVARVPDGWKMVPVEPTNGMRDAGHRAAWRSIPSLFDEGDAANVYRAMLSAAPEAPAQHLDTGKAAELFPEVSPITRLPDGSAFFTASYPLPSGHWLYAEREYALGADEPKELPEPILTHQQRETAIAAIRYAVRGATMCGKDMGFDPDALVQNAVYALCGPFTKAREAEKGGE